MKRQIMCPECRKRIYSIMGLEQVEDTHELYDPYPMEHTKIVHGTAKHSMLCDSCGGEINMDDICYAVSYWADYGGIPYYEWENEFMNTESIHK